MTDIKQKALVLVNEVLEKRGLERRQYIDLLMPTEEALCRAIELLEQEKAMHAERLLAMDARTTTVETRFAPAATKQELANFRQEVSDVVYRSLMSIAKGCAADAVGDLSRFVIPAPKPDPLVDVLLNMELSSDLEEGQHDAKWLRIKLDALGFEIRKKNDD